MRGLAIRDDVPAAELRRLARREPDRAAAGRMSAVANALEGMTRAEAARLAGMERQALRDAVVRYNAEGLAGLHNRPHPGPTPRLDEARRAALKQPILDGPDVEATGLSAWTLPDLCREVERRWDTCATMLGTWPRSCAASGCRARRPGPQGPARKARPAHPKVDLDAQAAFAKRGSRTRWTPSAPPTPASA
jgi:transposase